MKEIVRCSMAIEFCNVDSQCKHPKGHCFSEVWTSKSNLNKRCVSCDQEWIIPISLVKRSFAICPIEAYPRGIRHFLETLRE